MCQRGVVTSPGLLSTAGGWSGLLSTAGGPLIVADTHSAADGRSVDIQLRWAGHRIRLACVYLPNVASLQRAFIAERLLTLAGSAAAAREELVLGGDFNFVQDVTLDCLPRADLRAARLHPDTGTARRFTESLPGLVDVWRVQHRAGRLLTRFGQGTAARLDRFHIATGMAAYVGLYKVFAAGDHLSDHRAVAIQVRPRATPRDNGPKRLHRVRLNFSSDAAPREEFCEAASALAQRAPQHPAQLVQWWKGFKGAIFQLCESPLLAGMLLCRPHTACTRATPPPRIFHCLSRPGICPRPGPGTGTAGALGGTPAVRQPGNPLPVTLRHSHRRARACC